MRLLTSMRARFTFPVHCVSELFEKLEAFLIVHVPQGTVGGIQQLPGIGLAQQRVVDSGPTCIKAVSRV